MIALGSLSSLGYGPLAGIEIIGMQFLDFFDFLTNSVMMPIAAMLTSLFVSRIVGMKRMEEEIMHGESTFRREKDFYCDDQISVPGLCTDHTDQFRGKCIWLDSNVKRRNKF